MILSFNPLPSVYIRRRSPCESLSWPLRASSFELAISIFGSGNQGGTAYGTLSSMRVKFPARFSVQVRRAVVGVMLGAAFLPLLPRLLRRIRSTAVSNILLLRYVNSLAVVYATRSSTNKLSGIMCVSISKASIEVALYAPVTTRKHFS